jgi:hypothetical protein
MSSSIEILRFWFEIYLTIVTSTCLLDILHLLEENVKGKKKISTLIKINIQTLGQLMYEVTVYSL